MEAKEDDGNPFNPFPAERKRVGTKAWKPVLRKKRRSGRSQRRHEAKAALRAAKERELEAEEHSALLTWMRREIKHRHIGPSRLVNLCDGNRSNTVTLNEYEDAMGILGIHLGRMDYRRVFKAISTALLNWHRY